MAKMIYDDQPQMAGNPNSLVRIKATRVGLVHSFAAIDREVAIEKGADALARRGAFEDAEAVLIAVGIIPKYEHRANRTPPSLDHPSQTGGPGKARIVANQFEDDTHPSDLGVWT